MDGYPGDNDTYSQEAIDQRAEWYNKTELEKVGQKQAFVVGAIETNELEGDMRESYIFGQFLCVIAVVPIIIEHTLYWQLTQFDPEAKNQGHTLKYVLEEAKEYNLLEDEDIDVFDTTDEVCRIRNALVHYRDPSDDDYVTQRLFGDEKRMEEYHPSRLGKTDAENLIRSWFDIKARTMSNLPRIMAEHQQTTGSPPDKKENDR